MAHGPLLPSSKLAMVSCPTQTLSLSSHLFLLPFPLLKTLGFPGGSVVKNLAASAGDACLIPGWGRSPGGGHGNPLQYSYLEKPTDRGAWGRGEGCPTVHGVAESDRTE